MKKNVSRRNFLKGTLAVPILLSRESTAKQIEFYVPDINGKEYDNQLIELYNPRGILESSGYTTESRATLLTTGIDTRTPVINVKKGAWFNRDNNGNAFFNFPVYSNTTIYGTIIRESGKQIERTIPPRKFGPGNASLRLNTKGLPTGTYILNLKTDYGHIIGRFTLVDGIVIRGGKTSIPDIIKNIHIIPSGFEKTTDGLYKAVISHNDHFTRTIYFSLANGFTTVENIVVNHPSAESGVTPEVFRGFMIKGNTGIPGSQLGGYFKYIDENVMKYILTKNSRHGSDYDLTESEQDFVENVIRTKIFSPLNFEIPIEKKDDSYNWVDEPDLNRNTIHIFGGTGWSVGWRIIENNIYRELSVSVKKGYINERNVCRIMVENASAIYMHSEIDDDIISPYQSAFNMNSELADLQEVDILAYNVAKTFHKEHIDNVLNLY